MKLNLKRLSWWEWLTLAWVAYTLWKALNMVEARPAEATFWMVFIWMVLWLTDPTRMRGDR